MDMRDESPWPTPIQQKDDEHKQFHKTVSSSFLLMLDGNETQLPVDSLFDLCMLSEKSESAGEQPSSLRITLPSPDERYDQLFDIVEGLKGILSPPAHHEHDTFDDIQRFFSEFDELAAVAEDDFEMPPEHPAERRGNKPS